MRTLRRTSATVFVLAVVVQLAAGQAVSAQPGGPAAPGLWDNVSFGSEGPAVGGSLISAMAAGPDGSLYASGTFEVVGGVAARQIARWDGAAWHPLGSGLDFYASDLAAGAGETLYAVGPFYHAGGVAVDQAAVWDGAAWSPLGPALPDYVGAVAVGPDGAVYVAAYRYVPSSDYVTRVGRVLRLDGDAWTPVGGEFEAPPDESSEILDLLATADGALYAAGDTGVRRWSGTEWKPVGTRLGGRATALVADGAGGLYAAGRLVFDGPEGPAGVARWDGAAWSPVGTITHADVLAADATGALYAGGTELYADGDTIDLRGVARWDGAAWQPMAGGLADATVGGGYVGANALVLMPGGALHVGGVFDRAGGILSPTLARWQDGAWQGAGGGVNGLVRAVAFDGDGRPLIGGLFKTAGGEAVNYAAVRGEAGWQPMAGGLADPVVALERDRTGGLIACSFDTFRWDGAAWANAGLYPPYAFCHDLTTDREGNVYAAGLWGDGVGTAVQRWDGQAWRSLGTPAPPSDAYSVAVDSAGTVYAGGPFGVARLAGGAWQIIGSRASNEWPAGVYTLAVAPGGDVYAGGRFSSLGGTAAANVARWDGAAWHALGTGTDAPVRALAVDPARGVYVGGEFGTAGGTPAAHIALWDGATWRTLGDGLDGDVFALTRAGASVLYAGGRFGRAGAVPSPYVARWTAGAVAADAPPDEPSALRLDVSPSPARGTATARIRHPAGPVTVDLFDARGRHVAAALAGDGQAGEQAVPLRLGGLAPGVYVVRLVAGGSVRTRPLVVVR